MYIYALCSSCITGSSNKWHFFLSTVEMLKPGNTVIFRNARIDMFKDTMRLAVDKWGLIEVVEEPADFKVNEDNNMSEIEYELVNAPPKKQERKK